VFEKGGEFKRMGYSASHISPYGSLVHHNWLFFHIKKFLI